MLTKNDLGYSFYAFRKQGSLLHFQDILHNIFYFPQNDIYFVIFIFICSNNMFFINHGLIFKNQPSL